jgi:hypothetical protein
MNLATFRSRAARVSGMSTTDSGDLALIDGWANDAVVQFLRQTKLNVALASMAVTADQGNYTLDSDILAMQALWYAPADSQSAIMTPLAPETLIQRRLFETGENTPPRYYALAGANTLMLWPSPTASTETLHILYVPRPAALSVTSDAPSATANGNIPEEYHTILESYVKWKACEAEEHRPSESGASFRQEWEQGIAQVRGEVKKKAGVQIPSVIVGRPRYVPQSPGVDIR